jgi:hypothetical protein
MRARKPPCALDIPLGNCPIKCGMLCDHGVDAALAVAEAQAQRLNQQSALTEHAQRLGIGRCRIDTPSTTASTKGTEKNWRTARWLLLPTIWRNINDDSNPDAWNTK